MAASPPPLHLLPPLRLSASLSLSPSRPFSATVNVSLRGPKLTPSIDPADDFDDEASSTPGPWDDLDRAADAQPLGALGRIPKEYRAVAEGMVGVGNGGGAAAARSAHRDVSRDTKAIRRQSEAKSVHHNFPASPAAAAATGPRLTHVDASTGEASMVDVSAKASTVRTAVATGRLYVPPLALRLIEASEGRSQEDSDASMELQAAGAKLKGPVLQTARLAGVMGAKRTADLIPLCHPLPLSFVDVTLQVVTGSEGSEGVQHLEEPAETETDMTSTASTSPGGDGGFTLDDLDNFGLEELYALGSGASKKPSSGAGASAAANQAASRTSRSISSSSSSSSGSESDGAYISVTCTARTTGQTGVEMEALAGVQVTLLTLWDMLKSVAGREMRIGDVVVSSKSGGKSGDWVR